MLRRLIESLRHPDWPTVAMEFILVVAGIFIALQVDNWNESRKERNDAKVFTERLHQDILLAEELTLRLRDRRLGVLRTLIEASELLSDSGGRQALSDAQCFALGASAFFNINISDLPALRELIATGRMAIIEDRELRAGLVGLLQIKSSFERLLSTHLAAATTLPSAYPELIRGENYLEPDTGEVRIRFYCDTDGMRSHRGFMNDLVLNVDAYDVYYRDGLAPWFVQLDDVHRLVDAALGISHD